MWFEILPSMAIISVALAVPGYALLGLHNLVLGNVSRQLIKLDEVASPNL